jgi:hypothetical protein
MASTTLDIVKFSSSMYVFRTEAAATGHVQGAAAAEKIDMLVHWNHKEPTKNDQAQCIETSSISVRLAPFPFTIGSFHCPFLLHLECEN